MISDELFEKCLRALYFAPPDKPTLALLRDMSSVDEQGFRDALTIAYEAALPDVEWAGRCTDPEHQHEGDGAIYYTSRIRSRVRDAIGSSTRPFELVSRRTGVSPWEVSR